MVDVDLLLFSELQQQPRLYPFQIREVWLFASVHSFLPGAAAVRAADLISLPSEIVLVIEAAVKRRNLFLQFGTNNTDDWHDKFLQIINQRIQRASSAIAGHHATSIDRLNPAARPAACSDHNKSTSPAGYGISPANRSDFEYWNAKKSV